MKLKSFLPFLSLLIVLMSCGGGGTPIENIVKSEKNISFIASIDAQQIIDKGNFWKEFGWIKLLTGKMLDSNDWGMNIFSKKNLIITADEDGEQEFVIVYFKVNSAEKFSSRIGELAYGDEEEFNGYKLLLSEQAGEDFSLAWNKANGIAIVGVKPGVKVKPKLKEIIDHIDNPIDSEISEEIKDIITTSDDFKFVAYSNRLKNRYVDNQYTNNDEVLKLLEGAYFVGSLNGTDGSIDFSMEAKGMEKFMASKYNVMKSKGVSDQVLSVAVSDDILGLVSMSFEKGAMLDLLKDEMNQYPENDSLDVIAESMIKVLTGDVAISVLNLDIEGMGGSQVTLGVTNFDQAKKILDSLPDFVSVRDNVWKMEQKKYETDDLAGLSEELKSYLNEEDEEELEEMYLTLFKDYLIFSDTIAIPLKPKNSTDDFAGAKEKSFYMNIDLTKVMELDGAPIDASEFFESIESLKGDSDVKTTKISLKFKDKSKNGWKQLFGMLGGEMMNLF